MMSYHENSRPVYKWEQPIELSKRPKKTPITNPIQFEEIMPLMSVRSKMEKTG